MTKLPTAREQGFTLIELLVVIAILALLVTAFAPDIIGMMSRGQKAADKANLRWHYEQVLALKNQKKRYPKGSGHKFVLGPWIEGMVERTPENFERYFTPGITEEDFYVQELRELGTEGIANDLWRTYDAVTSQDTHYAGRDLQAKKSKKLMSGHEPWMGNDNELGPAFDDHTIHVVMGGGQIREILVDELIEDYGFDPDSGDAFPIGADSPHPVLQKLTQ